MKIVMIKTGKITEGVTPCSMCGEPSDIIVKGRPLCSMCASFAPMKKKKSRKELQLNEES